MKYTLVRGVTMKNPISYTIQMICSCIRMKYGAKEKNIMRKRNLDKLGILLKTLALQPPDMIDHT